MTKPESTSRSSAPSKKTASDDRAARPKPKRTAKAKPAGTSNKPSGKKRTGSSPAPVPPVTPELGRIDTSFFLIGVGASAGGLDAIRAFIAQIPADCPHSFIFIQHISPDYKSMMGELLRRETALQIAEVKDDMPIEPGHIYVIPPKVNVIIQGTHPSPHRAVLGKPVEHHKTLDEERGENFLRFALLDQPPRPTLNLPIDLFFHSLGEAVGNRAIGVILSGTGSDGSRGLRTIKDADGFVMVQDPETSSFDGMPRAAIGTHLADVVIPPDAMAKELYRYIELRQSGMIELERIFENSGEDFDNIISLVGDVAQIDFAKYKKPTLQRRIARRMALKECPSLSDYARIIQRDPNEVRILYREFLVGVTNFFRDMPAWESLRTQVIPQLFEDDDPNEPVKVWSVGCSTGEEAYTIAILLDDYRQTSETKRDYRVFATDVNERSIAFAKEGIFPESAIEDIPIEFANRYFSYKSGGLSVSEAIRKKVIFAEHNVVESPPYIHTDLVICRNMLIYMTPALQSQLISTFSYSLRHGRFLFLGASESVERGYSRFEAFDKRWRIFRNVSKARAVDIHRREAPPYFAPIADPTSSRRKPSVPEPVEVKRFEILDAVLPTVGVSVALLNEQWEVIETHGPYQNYLSLPEGRFSAKIIDLLPERLVGTVSIVLRQTTLQSDATHPAIRLDDGDQSPLVRISSKAVMHENGQRGYLVIFQEVPDNSVSAQLARDQATETNADDLGREHYIIELESELAKTRETLEATITDLGASNEELQSSNEELMSANEELQSTGEEMQSVNEELHTINFEHAEKIAELEAAYADIDNLLKSTHLAVVFLDGDMRIRRFSEAIKAHFQLDSRDIGRPISHFSSSLTAVSSQRVLSDIELVQSTGETKSYDVQSLDGSWYLATIQPFQTHQGDSSGTVMSFVDITQVKALQTELQVRRDALEAVLEGQMAGYWDWDIPNNRAYMSPQFKAMFGYTEDEVENTADAWRALIHPDDQPKVMARFEAHVQSKGGVPFDNEARYLHKDGAIIWVWCRGRVIEWGPDNAAIRMVGGHIDITSLKHREDEILSRAEEIRRFAYVSAHDLREPMSTIENYISLLQDSLGDTLQEPQTRFMEFAVTASQRMKAQIAGVVEYAKLQEGAFAFEPVDMTMLVRSCTDDMALAVQKQAAQIIIGDLSTVEGSPALLSRVVQNLLSNALKFHRDGIAPKIEISSKPAGKGFLAFRFADNGIGIDEKHRTKVFDLFTRLNAQSDYEGTGLGLALCRQIVTTHGGKIWVENGLDGGASIIFTLKDSTI